MACLFASAGIMFASDKLATIGSLVAVKVDKATLSNIIDIDESIIEIGDRLLGRVLRIEEIILDKEYGIGVCFVKSQEVEVEDLKRITEFLTT